MDPLRTIPRVDRTWLLDRTLDEAQRAASDAIGSLRAAVRECPSEALPELLAHAIEVLRRLESIDESIELARALAPAERAHEHARAARTCAIALCAEVARRRRVVGAAPD